MRGCLPLEGGGQGKDRQSLEMSIRSVFFAGAEVDLHGAIKKFPDILGESLQHSMMGKRIPLNYTSCKNYPSCKCVPVTTCPSHICYEEMHLQHLHVPSENEEGQEELPLRHLGSVAEAQGEGSGLLLLP